MIAAVVVASDTLGAVLFVAVASVVLAVDVFLTCWRLTTTGATERAGERLSSEV